MFGLIYLIGLYLAIKTYSHFRRGMTPFEYRLLLSLSIVVCIAGVAAPGYKKYASLHRPVIRIIQEFKNNVDVENAAPTESSSNTFNSTP